MLLPKKTKFRKYQRGRRRGFAKGQTAVQFGDYGLKSLEAAWLTNRQIEAARIAMTRKIKRGGKVWINVFPDKPVTPEAVADAPDTTTTKKQVEDPTKLESSGDESDEKSDN